MRIASSPSGVTFSRSDLLRWLYLGRLTVVTGILVGAMRTWLEVSQVTTLVATVLFVVAFLASIVSFWYTHILGREAGEGFLYAQVVLDVLLVTGVVHITGGPESNFASLYVLVIAAGALLLPLPGGVLIGGLTSIVYFADIAWFHEGGMEAQVVYQIALFAVVAFATGFVGDRLRRAGLALGEVESELRQLQLDTSDILTNLSTGVLTVDGAGRLAYLNPAGEQLLGLRSADWVGSPVVDAVEGVAPGMGVILRRSVEDGVPVSRFRTQVLREGGEIVLGASTTVLAREDGGQPSATALFQDITDLERIEALDRRTERLEAVAELSASLAHEIKNPLASIRSAVEQLARGPADVEDRATLERLVLSESDRLSRLLSEFLEFTGLRMGRAGTVDLASLVKDCLTLVRQHPEGGDAVEIRCEGLDGPLSVPGDADLLHRAVFNLVLNAVQFSRPDGRVDIRVTRDRTPVPAEATHVPRPVCLSIADTGPGLEPGDEARIFDPFYTTRQGGSGLGLAVVHRAVEAHQGAVVVQASPAGGAEFSIYLPGVRAERTEAIP